MNMKQTKTFLIIPGNPPASYFYQKWCDELALTYPQYTFKTIPYPRFNTNHSDKYFSDIIEYYKDIIHTQFKNHQIALIGHSIGGYFSTEILNRIPDQIEKCYLIFPFFGQAKLRGKYLLKLISTIDQTSILQKQFLKHKNLLGKIWKDLNFISHEELLASTRLAHHEKIHLQEFKKPLLDISHHHKLHLVYNHKDTWCPLNSVEKLQQMMNVTYIDSDHDFIVAPNQREQMTKLMGKFF